jgi:hypothetical protein
MDKISRLSPLPNGAPHRSAAATSPSIDFGVSVGA